MLVISRKEQESLIDMHEVLDYVEKALIAFSNEETQTPIRTALSFNNAENTALFMPSIAESLKSIGIKVVHVVPSNKALNKKTINGVVLLSNIETGEAEAVLEGSYITRIRTGALSGVATKYLSREDARTLGMIGIGEQSFGLFEAINVVRKIDKVLLYNRTRSKANDLAAYIEEKYGISTDTLSNANDIIESSDIVTTATNASVPVFSNALKQGTHLNAVGSFRPNMQEVPTNTIITADKVVVEAREAALEETGDLLEPVHKGFIPESITELGNIINGLEKGRENNQEITVFKSVGLAVIDIVVGQYIWEKARKRKLGTEIKL